MFEPVSIGICCYAALQGYARGGSALSNEAKSARNAACEIVQLVEQSHALFGEKAEILSQLESLALECSEAGWDGQDASPVNPIAILNADTFIRSLPPEVPIPELSPEPDGSISIDWVAASGSAYSISVGTNQRFAIAWLDGADRGHAVIHFNGYDVPERILKGIKETIGDATATLRAA